RCQFLLQQGLFAADLCYLTEEGAYSKSPKPTPPPPNGFDYDLLAPELMFADATVAQGRLVLPSGMNYSLLVLPQTQSMTPNLLRRLKGLVEAGATITGPPPTKSPSLAGFPACDSEVQALAKELWGTCDGKGVTEHHLGKGKVIWGR